MAQKSPLLRRFAVFSRNTKEISGDMSYPRISFYTLTFFRLKTCISLSECTLSDSFFLILFSSQFIYDTEREPQYHQRVGGVDGAVLVHIAGGETGAFKQLDAHGMTQRKERVGGID